MPERKAAAHLGAARIGKRFNIRDTKKAPGLIRAPFAFVISCVAAIRHVRVMLRD
jgi:hypothetical protein